MTQSKVFISGVAGFLGSHLADRLLEEGYQVSGCDNMLGGYRNNLSPKVEFHEVDAQDLDKMKDLLKDVHVVYHCAAAPHEGLSVFSPLLITKNTYLSTVSTVTAAVINKVRRVVFCSSMARYGYQGGGGGVFSEDMIPKPVDPYGVAKYASELFIQTMSEAHGIEYVIAVPHNIFGPRQKFNDPYRNVVSIMINLMLSGKRPIIYGDGEQKRSFTFVKDAVEPLVKMGSQDNVIGGIINIGSDEEFMTINEIEKIIADLVGFKGDPIYVPARPQEVKYASCSSDKARRLLEYKTTVSFEDGVKESIDWIKKEGPRPFEYHLELEIVNAKTPKTWTSKMF